MGRGMHSFIFVHTTPSNPRQLNIHLPATPTTNQSRIPHKILYPLPHLRTNLRCVGRERASATQIHVKNSPPNQRVRCLTFPEIFVYPAHIDLKILDMWEG